MANKEKAAQAKLIVNPGAGKVLESSKIIEHVTNYLLEQERKSLRQK